MGRVQAVNEDGIVRPRFDPSPDLIDARSKWYRAEVLLPKLEQIMRTGSGEMPFIGERDVTRSDDKDPRFHILNRDFCLPGEYTGTSVFVQGAICLTSETAQQYFQLTAFKDASLREVIARWRTEVGQATSKRAWSKETPDSEESR
jgi:hypothetical protein